jgi:GNAT superfamily N-acetyltransferase
MNFSAIFRKKILNNFADSFDTNREPGTDNEICSRDLKGITASKESAKIKNIIVYNNPTDNSIDFAIMLSENGQLLPICKKNNANKIIDLDKGLEVLGSSLSKVNTLMGDKESVASILKICFSRKIVSEGVNSFNYHTMTLDKNSFIPCKEYPQKINIRLAAQKDIKDLLPLQKNYEIEEVLPNAKMFNEAISRKHLSIILKNQITVVAEEAGKIIAKANTNEKGFIYYQIGGVYTLPEYRNTGISTALVSYLLENIFSRGMKTSLFVKTSNEAAIKVYTKLGFNKVEEFQITYFLYQ